MVFPEEYFNDEVREGFYVSSLMKTFWAAQLEALEEVDRLCKRHGIRWFADNGTLLGAVRHGGYVPWDDDLDICMLRDDYERFYELAEKELPEGYQAIRFGREGEFWEMLIRLTNARSLPVTDPEKYRKYHYCPFAVGVDIFPLDYVSPDPKKEAERKILVKNILNVAGFVGHEGKFGKEVAELLDRIEEISGKKLDRKKDLKFQLYKLADHYASQFGPEGCKEVVLMPYWVDHDDHNYRLEWFQHSVKLPFELGEIAAPAAYDKVLRTEYGSYLDIVREGGVHDYPAYGKQELVLREAAGGRLPYRFSSYFRKELITDGTERKLVRARDRAPDFADTLEKIAGKLPLLLGAGEHDAFAELLSQLQGGAIQVGTMIEERYGEGTRTVGLLEALCEDLYRANEAVFSEGEDDPAAAIEQILRRAGEIREEAQEELFAKKEAVFLVSRASGWEYLKPFWEKRARDDAWDVVLLYTPYYHKNFDGTVRAEISERDLLPEGFMPAADYDFEKRLPDEIYIQEPYDQCDYVRTLPDRCFAFHLRFVTDHLIYVPAFETDEIAEGEERAIGNMDHYVTAPAFCYADVIHVRSEALKAIYVDKLCEFAGEDTRGIWERKLKARETENDGVPKAAELPESWKELALKEDGGRKKILLLYTGIGTMIEYGEKSIRKLREVLDLLENSREELMTVWRTPKDFGEQLAENDPALMKQYEELRRRFENEGLGIADEESGDERIVSCADAYYGEASPLVQRFRRASKAVMIQNVDICQK
ncbi:MAG: LicD family protein [Lachnospiraceae bacterium]|nr:LicD family protein [Lachnospiraceae bacterium]